MLEGKLVRLRPLEPDDVDNYYQWLNDPEVTQFLAMRYNFSRAAEAEWLRERTSKPLGYDNLNFAIETLDEGRHVGSIGMHDTLPEDRKATVGIVIGVKDLWNHGLGTDAMQTLLRFAFDEMNLHRVMLHTDERNVRAIASYRRTGFVEEGRLRHDRFAAGRYWDTVVMGILEDEFRALHGEPAVSERDAYYTDPRVAAAYDSEVPEDWEGDRDFYMGLALEAHAAGQPVLELGSWTGRLTIPIAKAGVNVVGLDRSRAMLEIARAKSEGVNNVTWVEGDMAAFDLGRRFGLVMIPARSFLLLLKTEQQKSCLAAAHRHLLPGGRLALNFFNPDLRAIAEWMTIKRGSLQRIPDKPGTQLSARMKRWGSREYETSTQTLNDIRLDEQLSDDGAVISRIYRNLRLRYVFRFEMEHLLRLSGFEVEALFGSFSREAFTETSTEMVWLGRRD